MIVVTMTDCPPKLRGDVSKWLFEINTGVYVGNLSARVRDELWSRICENLSAGRATMVYSSNCEQHLDFKVHNTTWECVDLDGIKLMRRPTNPLSEISGREHEKFSSREGRRHELGQIERGRLKKMASNDYTVIDIETTGLNPNCDEIIELAAVKVSGGQQVSAFSRLIQLKEHELPASICVLTGISTELLEKEGTDSETALKEFLNYVGKDKVVGHNIAFDYAFIRCACRKCGIPALTNPCVDTLQIARKSIDNLADYKLQTVAEFFDIAVRQKHRALDDCKTTLEIYNKMREKEREKAEDP